MNKTVGIVLAGGQSRRFGSPKAFAKLNEKAFFELAVDALKEHCDEVVIVTRAELMSRFLTKSHVILDLEKYSGYGPLAGILSAMEVIEANCYVVLPIDMPYVEKEVIGKMLAKHHTSVTAVISKGQYHPLVSIWDGSHKARIKEQLKKQQLSVMKYLSDVETEWVEGSSLTNNETTVFRNVNTPESFERR